MNIGQEGAPWRSLRSMYVPGESHCMCLVEAADSGTVEAVNKEAGIPFRRVVEALDLGSRVSQSLEIPRVP